MFNYDIVIYERDGTTIVKPDALAETLKLDESLDSGVMVIPRSTRSELFRRFSKVKIEVNDGDYIEKRFYLIYKSNKRIQSKGQRKTWEHNIAFIEPIKWLEKFQVGNLTNRQPLIGSTKTLLDYANRLLRLTPFVPKDDIESTRIVQIDSDTADLLSKELAPQIDIEKKNLREAFIEYFKVINAIPRMYYDDGVWYIKADLINQRKLPFTVGENEIDFVEEASGENFAQAAEIFHENTIPDDDAGLIYEGSITDYIYYRADDIIVGEDTIKLLLSQKVSELKSLTMFIEKTGGVVEEVNINDYIFEKNVYDTLDLDDGIGSKSHALYWTYKSNVIDGMNFAFNAVFVGTALENIRDSVNGVGTIVNLIFKVEYIPYYETMRSKQYREDIDPYRIEDDLFDQYSAIQINQGEKLNRLMNLTSNVYGQIQRIGVETVSMSLKHYNLKPYHPDTNPNGVYQEGDYTEDGYIVNVVERVYGRTHLIARYELSKNWNRLSQFIQIDKEFRPYEISLSKNPTLRREIIFNIGFIEISSTVQGNQLTGADELKTTFMETLKRQAYENNITVMRFSFDDSDYYIVKPCGSLAEKNVLKWKLDMFDSKLAGKRVIDGEGWMSQIQEGVFYTDNNGEIVDIDIELLHNMLTKRRSYVATTRTSLRNFAKEIPYQNKSWRFLLENASSMFLEQIGYPVIVLDTIADLPIDEGDPYFPYEPTHFVIKASYTIYEMITVYNEIEEKWVIESTSLVYGGAAAEITQPTYSLPTYEIQKDSAEELGFEVTLPIVPHKDELNRFIIGESLVKENMLITIRKSQKLKFIVSFNDVIFKNNNKKLDLQITEVISEVFICSSDTLDISSQAYVLQDSDIVGNKLTIPSSFTDRKGYAIVDMAGNLYIAVNQVDLSGNKTVVNEIVFNLVKNRN